MTMGSPKGSATVAAYPKTLISIAASVGGLALFLIFASLLLVSRPIGSTVRGYFYGVDRSVKLGPLSFMNGTVTGLNGSGINGMEVSNSPLLGGNESVVESTSEVKSDDKGRVIDENQPFESQDTIKPINAQEVVASSSNSENVSETKEEVHQPVPVKEEVHQLVPVKEEVHQPVPVKEEVHQPVPIDGSSTESKDTQGVEQPRPAVPGLEAAPSNRNQTVDMGCDLYDGKWVYDHAGPLYTNNSCPVLTQMQNCQGNGRPDKEYENWRWKPTHCDLPRFDAKKFLNLMRGKTLAYVGDSVARNHMESMLCILWQVEVPKNRGNRRMQRYYFRSTSTMIVRIWSSWLIHKITEKFDFAPEGVDKLHLDAPDETFMDLITTFDVLVLSSGHWFAKQSVYILNNEIVGGQLWWPDNSRQKKIDSTEAFGISVETILTSLVTHPNYAGLTIVRSYSPDHYEGGAWNTGGSCTGKVKPALDSELVESGFTNIMHDKQVGGFNRAIKKKTNKSKLRLMDITKPFAYRLDGHPGPYRSTDPNKITKRGPDGRPPPQDCLHWCMPGPVDTWNELLLEIIRREFEGSQSEPL